MRLRSEALRRSRHQARLRGPSFQSRGPCLIETHQAFAGSDEGGRRAPAIYTLIQTANLNDIDPYAWLADVPARLRKARPELGMGLVPAYRRDVAELARGQALKMLKPHSL
jgi:hypothetical protein